MNPLDFLFLAIVAIPIGWIASMIGVGGGIFMVPLLSIVFGLETQIAVGTSLTAIVFNSASSTIGYARQKAVQFRLGLLLMPTAIGGVLLGGWLTEQLSSEVLAIAFGVLLVYVAVLMLWGKTPKDLAAKFQNVNADGQSEPHIAVIFVVGLLAGIASGFFGIGGGVVMVPALTLLLGIDIVLAVATSLFVMGPIAIMGALEHGLLLDNVRLHYALALATGIVVGAQLGTMTSVHIPKVLLRRLFGIVLLYSAVNMIFSKGLGWF